VPRSYKEDIWENQVSSVREPEEKKDSWESPFREDLSAEAENCPLLEAVTREGLVKTQHAGKDLSCAVVICEVWRLAMEL
jgi:hypothetical protein